MKKLEIFFLVSFKFIFNIGSAQVDYLTNSHMHHKQIFNPAYNSNKDLIAGVFYRNQYFDLKGAPTHFIGYVTKAIKNSNHIAGLSIGNEKVGIINKTSLKGNYAYKIDIEENEFINLGIGFGGNFFSANVEELDAIRSGDPAYNDFINNTFDPSFSFGVYYQSKKTALTFAFPNISRNIVRQNGLSYWENNTNFILGAEYIFHLNDFFDIKPSVFTRYVINAPINLEFQAHLIYNQFLWFGMGLNTNNSIHFQSSIDVMKALNTETSSGFRIGYSYEIVNRDLSRFTNNSHEIFFKFLVHKNASYKNYKISPRFF